MNAPVLHQESSYRRGLVLGFTVAEIMLLVLFALLLALAYAFALQQSQIEELRGKLALYTVVPTADQDVIRLAESLERYRLANAPDRDPNDYFRELTTRVEQAAKLSGELARTQEQLAEAQRKIDEIQNHAASAEAMMQELKNAGITAPTNDQDVQKLKQMMAFGAKAYAQAVAASGQNGLIDQRIADLMNQHIASVGTGGEHPSCWVNAETKKAEPIYDIFIMDAGYRVDEHFLPDRVNDRKGLPATGLTYGTLVSAAQFEAGVKSIYVWSTRQKPECRFHVEIFDRTSDTAKGTYKLGDQTIQNFFYPIKERVR